MKIITIKNRKYISVRALCLFAGLSESQYRQELVYLREHRLYGICRIKSGYNIGFMYALPVKCAGAFLQSLGMNEDKYYNELHPDHQCLKVLHSDPATSELINAINDFIIAYAKMNKLLLKSPAVAKDFTKLID